MKALHYDLFSWRMIKGHTLEHTHAEEDCLPFLRTKLLCFFQTQVRFGYYQKISNAKLCQLAVFDSHTRSKILLQSTRDGVGIYVQCSLHFCGMSMNL